MHGNPSGTSDLSGSAGPGGEAGTGSARGGETVRSRKGRKLPNEDPEPTHQAKARTVRSPSVEQPSLMRVPEPMRESPARVGNGGEEAGPASDERCATLAPMPSAAPS